MNKILCGLVIILALSPLSPAFGFVQMPTGLDEQENIIIGKKTRMYSEILGEWRPLEIYLPDDYENSVEPYPVMLVLDGGWRFNYCVSLVDMMSPNYMPRMIIVGLPNTDRQRDLNPYKDGVPEAEDHTGKFIRFLGQELFVYLGENIEPEITGFLQDILSQAISRSMPYFISLLFLVDTSPAILVFKIQSG